ncbi:hypothetical protein LINPERPRIM_LOCUS44280 [Linum perenne]
MFGSLVRENRRKIRLNQLGFIRLAKMPIQSLARLSWQFGPTNFPVVTKWPRKLRKSVNLSFPSDSRSGTIRQVTRLGILGGWFKGGKFLD